jgi:MFS superfamily sulfate permease-like transporter
VLFGIKDKDAGPEDHGWKKLPYLFEHLGEHCPNNLLLGNCVHLPTMTAAFISISFMIGMRLIKKHTGKLTGMGWIKFVPENLIVIIIAIIVSYSAKLEENYHMKILGDMDAKFPVPQFPHFGSTANFKLDLTAAGTISVIGFIESIVVAKLYANKNNYYVSPNRELVAVGLSNFVGSFFQTFPTFGSLTRSSVADMMGAQTQLFTLITSFVILLTIFLLGPLFAFLPKVVMSSIIFVAATGLFEFEDVEFMWKIKAWKDLFLFLLTFAMTVILGVDLGIFLSIGISLFFVVKYSSLPHLGILGRVPETKKYKDIKQVAEARVIPGILIVRIEEALYFANVEMIKQMLSRIERVGNPKAHPGDKRRGWTLHSIIIHSRNIPDMDASAIQVLAEMVEKYHERGIFVCFVKLREKLRHLFVRAHIIENAHSDIRLFESTDDAVTFVEDRVQRGEHDGTDIAEHGEH